MGSRVGREIDVDRVRASHDDGRRTTMATNEDDGVGTAPTHALDDDKTVIIHDVHVGEKRRTREGVDEDGKDTTREVRGKIDTTTTTKTMTTTTSAEAKDSKDLAPSTGDVKDDERTTTDKDKDKDEDKNTKAAPVFGGAASTGGFGSALTGAGFSGFGGLKAASTGGGFGGFAAAASTTTTSGFASAPSAPVFGGAKAPVALFGAGKKADGDEEEGEDDPEAELANDNIKPVVELEVVETKTGEEDETCAFRTEGALFEYVVDAEKGAQWVERGRGDLRLNEGESGSRLVMRAKGNYRLMLNAALFKGQKFKLMEGGKGVSFTCKNAVNGADAKMTTFALKMRAAASNAQSQADGFQAAATKAIAKLEDK